MLQAHKHTYIIIGCCGYGCCGGSGGGNVILVFRCWVYNVD